MAKTYLDIVKYMVVAKFTIDGLVDKPDIIGAVFGQTEGLLGDELDLRELQKGGKIGRIEIEVSPSGSKTYGRLLLPASLDRVETCILGAAVESVDRVGPFEAKFLVEKVEDTRAAKRMKILERAKGLIKQLLATEMPDSKELAEMVQREVKSSEITTYGPEKLPAGPDVGKADDVIIVEGRADVITLLKNDITNAVAVGGATSNIPATIIRLANEKESTIFVDGDRGGDLIIRSMLNAAELDFAAKAPDGKEVEELTRKEIIKALRSRVPIDQYMGNGRRQHDDHGRRDRDIRDARHGQYGSAHQQPQPPQPIRPQPQPAPQEPPQFPQQQFEPAGEPAGRQGQSDSDFLDSEEAPSLKDIRSEADEEEPEASSLQRIEPSRVGRPEGEPMPRPALESVLLGQLANGLVDLSGTLRSRLYSSDGSVIKEVPIRELLAALQDARAAYAVVLDGVITQRLVELSLEKGVKAIYGVRANPMPRRHPELILYTKEQGRIE
jgi:DNA primase